MTIDFSNIKSILSAFDKILKLDSLGKTPPVPPPLIIAGSQNRSGLSATRIASRIIARKSETGVNPGPLPSGVENPDDIMIRIIVEEIIKDLIENSIITVAVNPGTTITGVGASPSGPVTVLGSTLTIGTGNATIQ